MKSISIILLFCTLLTTAGLSQATTSKADNIRKLLQLTGAAKSGIQARQHVMDSFKQIYPDVTDDCRTDFIKEMNPDVLTDRIVPVYEKYYTGEDIKQLIAFYETPVGKKVISTLPSVMQESMQAGPGQAWGKEIAEKVMNNLKEKGFIKNDHSSPSISRQLLKQ